MIEIREASSSDIPLIQQLAQQVWYITYGPLQPKEKVDYLYNLMYSTSSLTQQMEEKHHRFLLAKDETGYLGYASYELNSNNQGKTKIHKIYVMPDAQGKGVGKELITMIEGIASGKDNVILSLNVFRHNPAINFYQKIGFSKAGEEKIDVGNGFVMDDFVMEKHLD
jgi:ribosomal protein S18 acetylase RimI-like enzyme